MLRAVLAVVAILVGMTVAFVLARGAQWRRATTDTVKRLSVTEPPVTVAALNRLPAPAVRYFQSALRGERRMVRSAIATQQAEFFINGAWKPLRATQHFRVSPPGFVWDARIDMAPLMPALVRDAYIDGRGSLQASLLGAYLLADQSGVPELNAGALQRFLGEAIWMPTALLPSRTVTWTAHDERSSFVTMKDSGIEVTLLFEFDDHGMVRTISGDRYKEDRGTYALHPWLIRCDEPGEQDGLVIPRRCEVAWLVNGEIQPYWRGRITSIDYQWW